MSEISMRALRLAFLDNESRVKLAGDAPMEDLNVLIGGPGSGKSTVIESLRYALEVPRRLDGRRYSSLTRHGPEPARE